MHFLERYKRKKLNSSHDLKKANTVSSVYREGQALSPNMPIKIYYSTINNERGVIKSAIFKKLDRN